MNESRTTLAPLSQSDGGPLRPVPTRPLPSVPAPTVQSARTGEPHYTPDEVTYDEGQWPVFKELYESYGKEAVS